MAWLAPITHADELRDVIERAPGTVGDPVATTAELQLAVLTPEGLSIDGAMPYEVRTLVDGFATPIFHLDGRSALTWWGSAMTLERAPGVQWGGGAGQLDAVTTMARPYPDTIPLTLTTLNAQLAVNDYERRAVLRAWWPTETPPPNMTRVRTWPHLDWQGSWTLAHTRHLSVRVAFLQMIDSEHYDDEIGAVATHHVSLYRDDTRLTLEELYRRGAWTGTFAQSVLGAIDESRYGLARHHGDTSIAFGVRNELRRTMRDVAGLSRFELRFGGEAQVTEHDLDIADAAARHENVPTTGIVPSDDTSHRFAGTIWTSDIGAWTSATAQLAANVHATTGLRLDAFGTDLALQPRGSLDLDLAPRYVADLSAGAYRRAPDHGDELEHPELHPERTSRVAFAVERRVDQRGHGAFGAVGLYYLDRTNLVEDDGTGKLANTGRGTTYGASGSAGVIVDHWFALATLVLEHSDRQQSPTMRSRPFEYDQPMRLDLRITRFLGPWQLGAHFSLREGLPYTRVAGAHYDSDRDVYLPDFATLYAERLPWQHQLDLRVDRSLGSRLRAYLDIANIYDERAAIGWDYNFNFTVRRAIAAPSILPTVGLRGEL